MRYLLALSALSTFLASAADSSGEELLAAARKGDATAVKALLDKGADVNSKNRYGSTPLFFACDRGHLEVVKLLIDRGANLNLHDTFYNATALTWAMSKKHDAIVELLVDRGADVGGILNQSVQSGDQKLFDLATRRGTLNKRMLDDALLLATLAKKESMAKTLESFGATPIKLEVPEAIGKAIAGKYQEGETTIPITYTDGKLFAGQQPLVPSGPGGTKDRFRLLQAGREIVFERKGCGLANPPPASPTPGAASVLRDVNGDCNAEGAVTAARISGRGGDTIYKKVN